MQILRVVILSAAHRFTLLWLVIRVLCAIKSTLPLDQLHTFMLLSDDQALFSIIRVLITQSCIYGVCW